MRARKPSRRDGERSRELESVELGGNAPPESEWLEGSQKKRLQGGRGWAFYLQGIWAELQQEAQGDPDDNFIFQGALNWDASDLFQVSISFSYFSL